MHYKRNAEGLTPAVRAIVRPLYVAEVAEMLGVDPTTVYRAIKAGRLKAYRIGAGRGTVRVPVASFVEYESVIIAAASAGVA